MEKRETLKLEREKFGIEVGSKLSLSYDCITLLKENKNSNYICIIAYAYTYIYFLACIFFYNHINIKIEKEKNVYILSQTTM
jgi:phosphotransferase system  glucose/maltose/N-acetylglucosamine-specific IIC component